VATSSLACYVYIASSSINLSSGYHVISFLQMTTSSLVNGVKWFAYFQVTGGADFLAKWQVVEEKFSKLLRFNTPITSVWLKIGIFVLILPALAYPYTRVSVAKLLWSRVV
jgi:hypothetical protein